MRKMKYKVQSTIYNGKSDIFGQKHQSQIIEATTKSNAALLYLTNHDKRVEIISHGYGRFTLSNDENYWIKVQAIMCQDNYIQKEDILRFTPLPLSLNVNLMVVAANNLYQQYPQLTKFACVLYAYGLYLNNEL